MMINWGNNLAKQDKTQTKFGTLPTVIVGRGGLIAGRGWKISEKIELILQNKARPNPLQGSLIGLIT